MRALLAAVLFVPVVAFAAPGVSFEFAAVPVSVFAQSTFKGLLHRDYVVSPELQSSDRKISVSVSNIALADVPSFVENILSEQGISVSERGGIYYLGPAAKSVPEGAKEALPVASEPDEMLPFGRREKEKVPDRRAQDLESAVYEPVNRSADFLASVIGAAFGAKAAAASGGLLVVTGTKADIVKINKLLETLDSLPKLVDVSASWVEVTTSASTGRGISLAAKVLGEKLSAQLGSVNSGSAISFGNTNFQLVVDALNSDGRFKQVSNSRVVGDDYEKLLLSVGDETPTVGSSGKDNAGNAVQNIVYRPSGVIVDVTPKVLGNGKIRLVVDGQISNFKATSTGVTGSPTLIKRQVKTTVTVGDGEVLLIGGLNDTQSTDSSSRWAFLPASWAAKSNTSSGSDLVLVLSAKVAKADQPN